MKACLRLLPLVLATLLLAACGLGDTAVTTAAAGKSKAEEVEQAKAMQEKMVNDVQQAQQQYEQRLREADSTEGR